MNDSLLTNDTNYYEKSIQDYETPSHQRDHHHHYDNFVNNPNDDIDNDENYHQSAKKTRYNETQRNFSFFDNSSGLQNSYDENGRGNGNEMVNNGNRDYDRNRDYNNWNNNGISMDRDREYQNNSQFTTPKMNTVTNNRSPLSPLIRPAHHHLGTPDEDTNLTYEATDNNVDKYGRKQTKLAFKKKRN